MSISWLYIIVAGVLEVSWTTALTYSVNFTKMLPSIISVSSAFFSMYFLNLSLKGVPIGTAYAVWSGIGTLGTALASVMLFGEAISVLKVICFILIVIGIAGLRMLS